MELLTDLLGADKHTSPALFCPMQLPEGHLALIKIPSVLLMRKSSSWAAACRNALGSSCARSRQWAHMDKSLTDILCSGSFSHAKASLRQMCLRRGVLSTPKRKSQSSRRGMHQNKSGTLYILWQHGSKSMEVQ